jgi:hypothetical protein
MATIKDEVSVWANSRSLCVRTCIAALAILLMLGVAGRAPTEAWAQSLESGYLTSASNLETISKQARWGVEPYHSLVDEFLSSIEPPESWPHGEAGGELTVVDGRCASDTARDGDRFVSYQGGAQAVYQKMIAYHLTHDVRYAEVVRDKLLEVTSTYGFGGDVYDGSNECILHLARAVPGWIQAADLLAGEPGWTESDRAQFSAWLIDTAYPKVAWASRVRRNNWGSAGSLAASMIADFVRGQGANLVEVAPEERILSPEEAFAEHNQIQLDRLNTEWEGDSRCDIWGIRSSGGIPDELRRGDTGCEGDWLVDNDDSYVYQVAQIDDLVFHAEFLRRRGNTMLFDNVAPDGSGSILRAILFVIDNPANPEQSYEWPVYKTGILTVANQYYQSETIAHEIYTESLERGGMIAFGQLTHPTLPN